MHTFSFFLLITPQQKRKSPVKSLATIGGALHSLLGFLFAVSSMQEEIKDLCSISPLDNLHSLLHWSLLMEKCRECCFCCLYPQADEISNHHKGHGIYTLWAVLCIGLTLAFPYVLLSCLPVFDAVSTAW